MYPHYAEGQSNETGKEKGRDFFGGNDQDGFKLLYLLQVSAFSLVFSFAWFCIPRM